MQRKNIFILTGILILVLAVVVFLLVRRPANNGSNVQSNNQPSTSSSAPLPTETVESQKNIQTVQKEVEKIVQEPITDQITQKGSELVKFNDQNNTPIPLADFKKATNITVIQKLGNYLDSKDYRLFYCPAVNNEKNFGIYLGYNVQKAYANLYPDTAGWMKDWEKTMLSDLHPVLFPNVNFSQSDLAQNVVFQDGKYRYAEINLPNGKTSSINYHISDNGVIISASPSCLDKLVQIYEPVQP